MTSFCVSLSGREYPAKFNPFRDLKGVNSKSSIRSDDSEVPDDRDNEELEDEYEAPKEFLPNKEKVLIAMRDGKIVTWSLVPFLHRVAKWGIRKLWRKKRSIASPDEIRRSENRHF